MYSKQKLFLLGATLCVSACNPDGLTGAVPNVVISHVPNTALSSFFVSDWTPFEAAANTLRTINPLYTVQQFSWWQNATPPIYDSYSIANARVEYAHAAGLTGAGQIISIVDAGFLTSHGEFAGKTIYQPGGGNNAGVDDHGTSVASVAAGIAGGGSIIGVAPGADLQLGYFGAGGPGSKPGADAARTAANNQAALLGAIVQNNSWGFDLDITNSSFQGQFSDTSGTTYLNSILNLAQNTVVVFAASNDSTRTTADLMTALPMLAPSLQSNWLGVINAVPTFTGTAITSGVIVSASCLEAAAWCVAADGSVYAATAAGNASYNYVFGSSFSAPQVSGAIALLAEAFPALGATELRARLLASADNQFYTHTGYVEFAPGVQHGFDTQFGHGFLNMQAALSPIGGSYLPRSSGGSVAVSSPTIMSAGLIGGTLSRRLANYDLVVVDGLGTGFELPASVLTAEAVSIYDPSAAIADLMTTDLSNEHVDPFARGSAFSEHAKGQELAFEAGKTRFAMLVPDRASDDIGLSVSRAYGAGRSQLRLGLNALYESEGYVGVSSLLPGENISGTHAEATMEWAVELADNQLFSVSGRIGVAQASENLSDLNLSPVAYNSLNLSYSLSDIWGIGDRVSFGIGLPQAIGSGQAQVTLPVAHSAGTASFNTVNVPLAPSSRQLDLSIGYGVPLSSASDVVFRALRSLNDGNVAGRDSSEAAIGLRFSF